MNTALTPEQRQTWNADGYLVLEGALGRDDVRSLRREVDRLFRTHVARNPDADPAKGLDRRNILRDSPAFLDLVDHPSTFGVVLDLLGPYIQLSMAQALVRPPGPKGTAYVHADGGQAMAAIRVTESSLPLQIKIQYFLTDVRGRDNGNFVVFPGSHYRPFPDAGGKITPDTPGAVQIEARAGDAALFPHALWHGVAPNRGTRPRKSLIYCYSQMCFRPFDFDGHTPDLLARCTPRQRRLLGDLGADWRPGAYFYGPKDQAEVMSRQK